MEITVTIVSEASALSPSAGTLGALPSGCSIARLARCGKLIPAALATSGASATQRRR